ncbi:hypothetical protein KXD40_001418 [Peronospora effusa]|nr:hypothetical protein KXD40_001418 [Peronospora effusa]
MQNMIKEGLFVTNSKYFEQGIPVHGTGYSMRLMLGQIMILYLGDHARKNGWDAGKVNFVDFCCPRVGEIGLAAHLCVLFEPQQLLIILHPSYTVHAFPTTGEGYADACIKIFLASIWKVLVDAHRGISRFFLAAFATIKVTMDVSVTRNAMRVCWVSHLFSPPSLFVIKRESRKVCCVYVDVHFVMKLTRTTWAHLQAARGSGHTVSLPRAVVVVLVGDKKRCTNRCR